MIESALFGGPFPQWLLDTFGIRYDQRNAIVVGLAMGFAVIPIIFAISEDAFSNVPQHLTAGSLALGASRWQTVTRVVLPTASPGIFSAVMVGFGRAVGETMIVLMATGNTPITDWSPFNGFRTLSANVAVEIPEAPAGGTLYRTLFLAALLLFVLTFLVNTLPRSCASVSASGTRGYEAGHEAARARPARLGTLHVALRRRAGPEPPDDLRAARSAPRWNGARLFWQRELERLSSRRRHASSSAIVHEREDVPGEPARMASRNPTSLRDGNRDSRGADFRWIDEKEVAARDTPADAVLLERLEWGPFYGSMEELRRGDEVLVEGPRRPGRPSSRCTRPSCASGKRSRIWSGERSHV